MPPITLTPAQFAQTAAGQKPGASYGNYKAYLAAHRTAAPAAPPAAGAPGASPLTPYTNQQIQAIIARAQGQMGTPATEAQIGSSAQGMISPIIAAVTSSANAKAAAAGQAIKGYTDSLASILGQENFAAPYQTGEQSQAAVDAALQQSLTNQGTDLAAGLSSRLGVINDPSTAAAASGLAARGAALGTTELAAGSSALSELISNAASAGEYGLKQPVIARNAGIQGLEQAQGNAQGEIATGTQSALSQLPSIVQSLEDRNATLRANRAQLGASLFGTLSGQNLSKATIAAGLQTAGERAQATVTAAQVRAQAAAAKTQAAASAKATADAAKSGKISVTWSRINKVASDQNGNPILRNGKTIPYTGTGGAGVKPPKPLTVTQAQHATTDAFNIANNGFLGVNYDKKGNKSTVPKLTAQQAWDHMQQQGLLADPRTYAIALKEIVKVYGAGADVIAKGMTAAQKRIAALALPSLPAWAGALPTAPSPYNKAHPGKVK